jgi:pumilio homology domain family member 6
LKVLKEQGSSLAIHEHGHLLILAVLSSIDDTVLVNKLLVSILLKDVKSLAKEEWGRKVILWLVAHEDRTYFHPTFLEWLNDGLKKGTSKKPAEQRAAELLKDALPALCDSVRDDLEYWLGSGSMSLTALAIIKAGEYYRF